ncbi:MAG: SAM-dependent methyltransferase [Gemmataceae bacterium]
MTFTSESLRELVRQTVLSPGFVRAVLGGVMRGTTCEWLRITIRPLVLRNEPHLQFTRFDGRKDFARNVPLVDAANELDAVLAAGYSGIRLETETEEIDLRTSKKGKVFVGRKKIQRDAVAATHNRVKDVPLPEGRADRVLEIMGIATADGRVKPTMRAKFTQINEFLKHLGHLLDDAGLKSLGRPLEILDCGCGSSHLTIAAHHYLNDVLGIPARLIGVDVNEEVIRKSMQRAERLGAADLNFTCGPIGTVAAKPDVVFALHACDTATDDALARAVACEAKLILAVPCCHHHLNEQIQSDVLRPILRHGILHQRTADLATDAFRALALRIMGYRAEVVEFISPEHTARNLMIRAVRGTLAGEAAFVREYQDMKRFWNATPFIESALGEPFRSLLAGRASDGGLISAVAGASG